MKLNQPDQPLTGLTEQEVLDRQNRDGFNELEQKKSRQFLDLIKDIVKEPMFMLLVACGTLYLILGDVQEGIMLLGFVFFIMGIEYYQERKTSKALDALKELTSPRARVIRNGVEQYIPSREVVVDDLVMLTEGERIPADGVLLDSLSLQVDESLLTGESVPVRKQAAELREGAPTSGSDDAFQTEGEHGPTPGGDDTPFVFSGCLVVQGNGMARIAAIGASTEIGKIGKALGEQEQEPGKLNVELNKLVKRLALGGLGLCVLVLVVYYLTRGSLLHGFLAGLTLAMGILPEEFPVILTIFMALGAWRISKQHVLARRPAVIETLGSATVLCTDKTGTLTQNRMRVNTLYNKETFLDASTMAVFPEAFHEIIEYGILSSQIKPNDPMEKAICDLGEQFLQNTEHLHHDWFMVKEYPLSKEMLAMSRVFVERTSNDRVIATKGAPESIFDLCHLEDTAEYERAILHMASRGLRVLGVAKAKLCQDELPCNQHDFDFEFIGLIGLSDPVRPEVKAAVEECYRAGVRVVMITGDYPITAQNIANEIGLKHADACITGPELQAMSDEELAERIGSVTVFARVVPEQKLKLVNALKQRGDIVAMTGDGVNDAPALKAAHIGIAMGERGTDVAREASSLVLTDDNFSSIVGSVRMGRRIFDNMQKAFGYVFAVHVPMAGLSLIPIFFADAPLLLFPVHVVFLELIIDPACSIIFEAEKEEPNVMNRPPRSIHQKFFGSRNILLSCLQGFSILFVILGLYAGGLAYGLEAETVRAMSFVALIVANIMTILVNRSWSESLFNILRTPNASVKWIVGAAVLFLTAVLSIPFLQRLFQFSALSWSELLIAIGAGLLTVVWFEAYKAFHGKK